jgi:hypothetical protein
MAVYDGGGTSERHLRGACERLGVTYRRPEFELFTIDHGQGFHELSWLTGSSDGWHNGRRCPLELPARANDGTLADDPRSAELVALIENTRRRAAA